MKHAVEVGSAVIYSYITSFMKTGSAIRKLMVEGIHRHTESMVIA
jgi:hypothetical protein